MFYMAMRCLPPILAQYLKKSFTLSHQISRDDCLIEIMIPIVLGITGSKFKVKGAIKVESNSVQYIKNPFMQSSNFVR